MSLNFCLFSSAKNSFFPSQNESLTQKKWADDAHRPLHVERVEPEDYPKIEQIAKDWATIAKKRMDTLRLSKGSEEYARLNDCEYIAREIERDVAKAIKSDSSPSQSLLPKQLYVCKDTKEEIHGLAMVQQKPPLLWVHSLVTHPDNIRCEANHSKSQRVGGIGRKFCKVVEEQAPERGINIIGLQPLFSSIPFYLKCGFQENPSGEMIKRLPAPSQTPSKL